MDDAVSATGSDVREDLIAELDSLVLECRSYQGLERPALMAYLATYVGGIAKDLRESGSVDAEAVGGLNRIVLDDIEFADGPLGRRLLDVVGRLWRVRADAGS